MARKRMISPEIWTSQDFSELSNFEKIVFISLFSHADDEGRGVAEASFIASATFPFDKNRRDTDIEKALTKIALTMSVQLYSINGRKYYVMTNWKRWQKIDKPSKSKLPPPPFVGEGGGVPKTEKFDYCSGSVRGVFDESSANVIENNRIEENNIPPSAGACVDEEFTAKLQAFCKKWNIVIDTNSALIANLDFDKLDKAYSESKTLLQDSDKAPYARTLSWVVKNQASILAGKYKDRSDGKVSRKAASSQQTSEMLKGIFNHYKAEEDSNDTY